MRKLVLLYSVLVPIFGQPPIVVRNPTPNYEAPTALAVDRQGNTWLAGVTSSPDFPLANAISPAPTASPLVFSNDGGAHWINWAKFGSATPTAIAFDPQQPSTFYIAFANQLYRTLDRGDTFSLLAQLDAINITELVVDPFNSKRLYFLDRTGSHYRSTDGGKTWTPLKFLPGIPAVYNLQLHPRKPNQVWAWTGSYMLLSNDSGDTWANSSLPLRPNSFYAGDFRILFDPINPDLLYGPGFDPTSGLVRSTDGGATWSPLPTFASPTTARTHPTLPNIIYALLPDRQSFTRSSDTGQTWQTFPIPPTVDAPPSVTSIDRESLTVGRYSSFDGGRAWSLLTTSRALPLIALSPDGLALATAPASLRAFLTRYPNGSKAADFSTTFGGSGSDTILSLRPASNGDAWIFGVTSSVDLPTTPDALQPNLKGPRNAFLARVSPQGAILYCSYFGSTGDDTPTAMDLDSRGNVWFTGRVRDPNAPYLAKLRPDGAQLLFLSYFEDAPSLQPNALRVDPFDNPILAGTVSGAQFPATPGSWAPSFTPDSKAFVWKFDPSGKTLFATYFGGRTRPPGQNDSSTSSINALEIAPNGDLLLAGNTPYADFPTTPNALQPALKFGCPFPTSIIQTGLIGSFNIYYNDDFFLARLSADGTQLLSSTFLGGACYDYPTALALSANGSLAISGISSSPDFPQLNPQSPIPTLGLGSQKPTLTILNPSWSSLTLSTFLDLSGAPLLALTPDGKLRVAGAQAGKVILLQ